MYPLLSIQDLSVEFDQDGKKTGAVANSSLTVAAGELLAIVGESGSGKSVTALSVLQLLPPSCKMKGRLLFSLNGETFTDLAKLDKPSLDAIRGNDIAMIFQEPMTSLNPLITCGEQVAEVIRMHRCADKKTAHEETIALFADVQLPDPAAIYHRYPHQLSGGQKQRVMIAMAMSCKPALLIADEPTTALDVTVQRSILELIARLQKEKNMGVILITHDLGVVADIADSIAVMYKGEIVEQGKAAAILQHPRHPYTKALLACRPAGRSKEERLPVVSDFTGGTDEKADRKLKKRFISPSSGVVALEVKDLVVRFPAHKNFFGKPTRYFHAVDGVSFTICKGETVGLVGESGCGKTTLGKAILQLIPPHAGTIRLNGKELEHLSEPAMRRERKDLQVVFQDPYGSLNPRITIGRSVMEPLAVHGLLKNKEQRFAKMQELLISVDLPSDQYNRYPHQFSGGQRQRICIARALASDPSFLVFDESVSALDISVQAQVLNLLNDLRSELGFTAIFISHDLSVVHYFCDRIMVMRNGKITEEGAADDVYRNPKNEYTRVLINAIPGQKTFQSS